MYSQLINAPRVFYFSAIHFSVILALPFLHHSTFSMYVLRMFMEREAK